jgi:hypothetical protein
MPFRDPRAELKRDDKQKSMIVEFRSTGGQTLAPPSVHPETGERLCWEQLGTSPTVIDAHVLYKLVALVAAAALCARAWPAEGSRQDVALALAGFLLSAGWPPAEVEKFIGEAASAAGDEEAEKRRDTVGRTAEKLARGESVHAGARLAELLGGSVVGQLKKWLQIQATKVNGKKPTVTDPRPMVTPNGFVNPVSGIKISNFTARITRCVTRDDGTAEDVRYTVRSLHSQAEREFELSASDFATMSWVGTHVAPTAYCTPRHREEVCVAIRQHSEDYENRVVFAQTGWRMVEGQQVFLHAGGGICSTGTLDTVEVDLPDALLGFRLPAPPTMDGLCEGCGSLWTCSTSRRWR